MNHSATKPILNIEKSEDSVENTSVRLSKLEYWLQLIGRISSSESMSYYK
jgi:hypothetical protein